MSPVSDTEDGEGRGQKEALSREDCLCPVCLEILMEPVTLPCTHTFCKVCFLESVDKATLCCPMCRKRVSTWARLHSRNNTLVNQKLWKRIQTCFPLQCERRLRGQDEADDTRSGLVFFHRLSEPGELRQEYEDQITKLTEEKRVLEEEERRASEEYIQRLLAEEEQLLQEDMRRKEEDEQLARLLSDQLNPPVVSQDLLRPVEVSAAKKKKDVSVGHIERFFSPRVAPPSSTCSSASSFMSNKENILLSERPPPQLDFYGPQTELRPPEEEEEHQLIRSSSVKRKSSELEDQEEEESAKRGRHLLSSFVLQEEAERELQERQRQEEEDRQLAMLLQKELDQEEKRRATDRRKGSADAYQLRQARGGKEAARASRTLRTCTATSPCCSSPSSGAAKTSSSSSGRGSKQTTLTEMFSFSS